ncbi:MAG: peptide ABC transporter substrate-binding protein [Gammaproteobacteria bacterium]|nr:peptide ABC transporter substrate-binding protein [Gammaproteobacteria bacterium]
MKRFSVRTTLLLAAGLFLAGCSDEPGTGPVSQETTAKPSTVVGTERAAQQVLHRGNGAEPDTLDPHRSESTTASQILRSLYEGLLTEQPDGTLVPGVATEWKVAEDGLSWTFKLRPEARWSNGDPVVASDFVAGMRRTVDPATGGAYGQILAPIRNAEEIIAGKMAPETLGVVAPDEHTLRINLKGPTPYLPGLTTHTAAYPIHVPSLKEYGAGFPRPGKLVGNGAYVLTEWVVNDHLTVERNPHYWGNANTVIDKVVYYPIEDQSTELKRYRAGELDWTNEIPNSQFHWIQENLPGELHVDPQLATYYYGFNLTRPPFKDNLKLRKALSMAVDREILTEKVSGVGEVPAYGWVPPGVANYTSQQFEYHNWPRAKRLAEAKRLYAEAGYSADKPLKVEIRYNTSENHKKIAIAVASMWKSNLGVEATLLNEEWKVFLENRKAKQVTEVFRDGWNGDYNDPYTFAELMHTGHGLNDPGYSNPEYDRLIEAAAAELDATKRRQYMEAAERLMLADHPMIPLYHYVTKRLVKPWVAGYRNNIMDHHYIKNYYILQH